MLCHVLHVSLVLKCSYSTPFCQPRYVRYRELTWFKVQLSARFVISHLGLGIYTLNGWLHFFQLHRAKEMVMTTGGVTGGGGWGWDITSTRNNQVTVQALCCKRKNEYTAKWHGFLHFALQSNSWYFLYIDILNKMQCLKHSRSFQQSTWNSFAIALLWSKYSDLWWIFPHVRRQLYESGVGTKLPLYK